MSDPLFLTLAAWGGTPNGWPAMQLPATALWVHHSVTNEDLGVTPTDDAIADFQELDAIGRSRGHGGISYSYAIHPEGVIGEGQGLRRGAHTAGNGCGGSPWGWNPCSFGVVFIGNYDDDTLTDAAINAFRWLRDVLIAGGHLVPGTYPTGGHRDAPGNSTGCPGADVEARLEQLRAPYSSTPNRKEARMLPSLFVDANGAVWVYDPNTKSKTWVTGPPELAAIQTAWSVAAYNNKPAGDPTIYRNATTDTLLAGAIENRTPKDGGGPIDLSGFTISGTFTGTAKP